VENVLIGGTQAGEGNNLNGLVGVMIFYTSAAEEEEPALTIDNIAILGNTIDAEGGIAWLIDTDGDFNPEYTEGLISNDTLDTLSVLGPNRLIHTPEIISTTDNGDDTFTVTYEIDVDAGEYRMEWYRDAEVSNADSGIGNEFLDSVDIIHAGNGPETFTIILPVALDDILAVTLTEIIDPGTNDWNFGATSQFSEQFVVVLAVEEQPTPTRSSSGGRASVVVLANLGIQIEANETTPTIESLTKKIAELQTLLRQLQNQSTSPSSLVCTPPLRIGSTGAMVQLLQTKLNITPADGIFGPKTEQSVRTFQQQKNLMVDGVVGLKTCVML
jgi:peptidoglycan hydrolase-like protein with peptidoglycan-binding domain